MSMQRTALMVSALFGLGLALPARAGIIDLRELPGNIDQFTFGSTGSEHYAQSLTADDSALVELVFGITDNEGGSFRAQVTGARAAVVPGTTTGTAPDASRVLFEQSLNHLGGGLQWFTLNPNVAASVGDIYFLNLNAFGETLSGASVRTTFGSDQYAGGELIFSNTDSDLSNTLSWSDALSNQDFAIRAVFDDGGPQEVPVPATLALIGLGLTGLGLRRRHGIHTVTPLTLRRAC